MKAWMFITIFALGCSPVVPDDWTDASDVSSGDVSGGDEVTAGGTDTETGALCEPPGILCDGECVNSESDENCGSCGHVCEFNGISGHCADGRCTARETECFAEEAGFSTCREYCSSIGEQCGYGKEENSHPCWNTVHAFYTESCQYGVGTYSPENPEEACDWQIPWGEIFVPLPEMYTVQSAICCCTQHGGE